VTKPNPPDVPRPIAGANDRSEGLGQILQGNRPSPPLLIKYRSPKAVGDETLSFAIDLDLTPVLAGLKIDGSNEVVETLSFEGFRWSARCSLSSGRPNSSSDSSSNKFSLGSSKSPLVYLIRLVPTNRRAVSIGVTAKGTTHQRNRGVFAAQLARFPLVLHPPNTQSLICSFCPSPLRR
jgi:hypothetical protein